MPKVIIFNAPPNSGKDLAVDYLVESGVGVKFQFKDKLYKLLQVIYDLSDLQLGYLSLRENKETPYTLLDGLSLRQALIGLSEDVIKPAYGEDYFGICASETIKDTDVALFSDGGFEEEILPILDCIGTDNVLVVRIHREGCDYTGDSRNYLPDTVNGIDINTIDIRNNNTIDDFLIQVKEVTYRWLQSQLT